MCAAAVGLAYGALAIDRGQPDGWWGYGGSAEGATAVLETIAGSMMTVAGVVFSLTLVALSLASAQFGPRLLRNFMRDTVNQTVLGTFIATFLYCVLVMLAVRRPPDEVFVPNIAVSLGVVLAVASMVVLVYFIHHVALSIQADELIARIARELTQRSDELFPDPVGEDAEAAQGLRDAMPSHKAGGRAVLSAADGYLQRIDPDGLMSFACENDLVVRVEHSPGDFVLEDSPLATVWPAERVTPGLADELRDAFVLGSQRTPAQDMGFALRQLVEMATRALSPSINDPFTAIACIDRLAASLHRLARRANPTSCRVDSAGTVRIHAPATTCANLVDEVFNAMRQAAGSQPAVMARLVNALSGLLAAAHRPEDRRALRRQLERVRAVAAARAAGSPEWPGICEMCDAALEAPIVRAAD